MITVVGIDPGNKGGVVVLDGKGEIKRGWKTRLTAGKINWGGMYELFQSIANMEPGCVAAIERQAAFTIKGEKGEPQVMASTSIILQNYGRYKLLLEFAKIPYTEVWPQTWQAAFRPRSPRKKGPQSADDKIQANKANKIQMMKIAKSLWPETARKVGDTMQDGFWESALIASFHQQALKVPT